MAVVGIIGCLPFLGDGEQIIDFDTFRPRNPYALGVVEPDGLCGARISPSRPLGFIGVVVANTILASGQYRRIRRMIIRTFLPYSSTVVRGDASPSQCAASQCPQLNCTLRLTGQKIQSETLVHNAFTLSSPRKIGIAVRTAFTHHEKIVLVASAADKRKSLTDNPEQKRRQNALVSEIPEHGMLQQGSADLIPHPPPAQPDVPLFTDLPDRDDSASVGKRRYRLRRIPIRTIKTRV